MKCWSCNSTELWCYPGCECAKCVDPEAYEDWKYNNPEEYDAWLNKQADKEEDEFGY